MNERLTSERLKIGSLESLTPRGKEGIMPLSHLNPVVHTVTTNCSVIIYDVLWCILLLVYSL